MSATILTRECQSFHDKRVLLLFTIIVRANNQYDQGITDISGISNPYLISGYLVLFGIPDLVFSITFWKVNLFLFSYCTLFALGDFFRHYSSALLSIMSVEKCVALYFPLKTKTLCTVATAKRATVAIAIILAALDSPLFYMYGVMEDELDFYCGYKNLQLYQLIFNKLNPTLYSYAPFCIMGVSNIAIIYILIKAKIQSKHGGTASTNQALNKAALKGTTNLIAVSLTFILLTGPLAIGYAVIKFHPITYLVVYQLSALNHGINCVLYCIVGSKFRKELLYLLICCKKKEKILTRSQRHVGDSMSLPTSVTS